MQYLQKTVPTHHTSPQKLWIDGSKTITRPDLGRCHTQLASVLDRHSLSVGCHHSAPAWVTTKHTYNPSTSFYLLLFHHVSPCFTMFQLGTWKYGSHWIVKQIQEKIAQTEKWTCGSLPASCVSLDSRELPPFQKTHQTYLQYRVQHTLPPPTSGPTSGCCVVYFSPLSVSALSASFGPCGHRDEAASRVDFFFFWWDMMGLNVTSGRELLDDENDDFI